MVVSFMISGFCGRNDNLDKTLDWVVGLMGIILIVLVVVVILDGGCRGGGDDRGGGGGG